MYTWSPGGGSTPSVSGKCVGTYTCTIDDLAGCQITQTFSITQPPALTTSGGQTNILCNGQCTGSATVTPSGGTTPYSYSWLPSGGNSATASSLCAGTYTVTVTDANGCTTTRIFNITQPPALSASAASSPSICGSGNGSVTVTPVGGTPAYSYSWTPNVSSGSTASNLAAGNYSILVTDVNGCTTTVTVNVASTGSISASITAFTNVSCFGGSDGTATVTPSGGTTPYSYVWSPIGGNGPIANNLPIGSYTVNVTDNSGCTASATVTITQPPQLSISGAQTDVLCNGQCTGSATVTPGGGTPPYSYAWTPSGGNGSSAGALCAGSYTATERTR